MLSRYKKEIIDPAKKKWPELEVFPDFRHPLKGPAARLRGARTKMEMSQAELARRTGIRQSHISEMERGERVIGKKVAQKLAIGLKVDYRVFL
ncbi:MAG: helix-turn-helix transcriptional regulator [Deltaproteobacteria bacterium]|nr:helix-turn-helix transcriptional regulator [Deltaproteobacteria bacterium]